jgi:glycyl-tRNA synthetase
MTLHHFWQEQGCLLWQPYNIQVGAGTNNPATLLRVLGPEPWRVAYVEPSIRPDDGRYGENPNRMQMFYQYQVILKPDPGNPQELYLQSLAAIGIDLSKHDVRFVEDNWKSPAIGAWGLGWEVWLDGQEITQFTYFQQAGGVKTDPVSVEITYGLERIVKALQDTDAVWEMEWTDDITYNDIFMQSEIEHCKYYFDVADVDALRQVYNTYERESQRALEAGLVVPSYDYVLKCSHLFNVLDTRGAIGVTERAGYFRRMATMTRNVAKAYLEQRQRLEYPLINNGKSWPVAKVDADVVARANGKAPSDKTQFLLEIGVEELPAEDLDSAIAQLNDLATKLLGDQRLAAQSLKVDGTPRRLVIKATIAARQPDEDKVVKGPPANKAFDADGKPTAVAEGFAKKQGIPVSDLQRSTVDGGDYVTAAVKSIGKTAIEVLAEELPKLIAGVKFEQSMRWNASGIAFSRPIRWILALLDDEVIPFEYAGVKSGRSTRGSVLARAQEYPLKDVSDYFTDLLPLIDLDPAVRREAISLNVRQLMEAVGGVYTPDEELLSEVTNLVEAPAPFRGQFDPRFLELPRDVLITVMRKKQRYFPVQDANGNILPYFIGVANGSKELADVIKGNEHVLTARFSDADFFFKDDRQHALADRVDRLKTMTFQEKLGSIYDKNQRLIRYVEPLGKLLGYSEDVLKTANEAAVIAKADQATHMVVEMTSLEGVLGREYALLEGRPAPVADAILEHYRPHEKISPAGLLLAIADRLDSLVGLFAVGLAPTASADPFALRRAALGVVQVLLDQKVDLDLRQVLPIIAAEQPVLLTDDVQSSVLTFITGRLRVLMLEDRKLASFDVVDAVLAEQAHNPYRASVGVQELSQWVARPDWSNVLDSFARCVRITREEPAYELKPDALTPAESTALYTATKQAHDKLTEQDNVNAFLSAFETMVPTVTAFFDHVFVRDDDQAVRENRLALLQYVTALAKGRADLSRLSGF